MVKKSASKKKSVKKKALVNSSKSSSTGNVDKILLQNFVSLQKVMVNLSEKLIVLNNQVSKFQEALKSYFKNQIFSPHTSHF